MPKGNFIDYIVSDDPNKYPSIGKQGEYYYEMVGDGIDISKLGCTKFEEGTFTPASDGSKVKINHSLGVIPKFLLVYLDESELSASTSYQMIVSCANQENATRYVGRNVYSYIAGNTSELYYYSGSSGGSTWTTSKAELNTTSNYFKSGKTYKYLLLG